MLTPQELQDQTFVKAVFGGYDMAGVDTFLEQVGDDYAALYKENAVLKGKLKVLVDTVEEYRSVDDAMRKALMTAQKMASDMMEDAKQKSGEMVASAEEQAKVQIDTLDAQIAQERQRLEMARAETESFMRETLQRYRQHMSALESLVSAELEIPAALEPDRLDSAAKDIESTLRAAFAQQSAPVPEVQAAPAPPEEVPAPQEPVQAEMPVQDETAVPSGMESQVISVQLKQNIPELDDEALAGEGDTGDIPTPIDFDNLQFGREYSMPGGKK